MISPRCSNFSPTHSDSRMSMCIPGLSGKNPLTESQCAADVISERDLPELYELIEKEGIPVNYLPRIPGKGCMAHSADAS